MKKFNVEIENKESNHRFSFLAIDMESALSRLKALNLYCLSINELPENWSGKLRVPEEMYG